MNERVAKILGWEQDEPADEWDGGTYHWFHKGKMGKVLDESGVPKPWLYEPDYTVDELLVWLKANTSFVVIGCTDSDPWCNVGGHQGVFEAPTLLEALELAVLYVADRNP